MNDKNAGILSKITVEARTEVIKELFSDVAGLIDKSDAKMAKLVEILKQQKDAVGHGKWIPYLKDNFGGDAAVKRVQYYMRKVDESNSRIFNYLEDAESQPKTVPRSERKPASVTITTPVDHFVDADKMVDKVVDDDPAPEPPTIRKTAKGSEKVIDDKKPKTAAIVPEILPDEDTGPTDAVAAYLEVVAPVQVVRDILTRISDESLRIKEVRRIRKELDKFDPPTKFQKPDLEDVASYFTELKAIDPESFFDFYESKGWLVGKVGMKDWRASARKWVRENHANGKGNSNGHRTSETSNLGSNGRPAVERAKVTYK